MCDQDYIQKRLAALESARQAQENERKWLLEALEHQRKPAECQIEDGVRLKSATIKTSKTGTKDGNDMSMLRMDSSDECDGLDLGAPSLYHGHREPTGSYDPSGLTRQW